MYSMRNNIFANFYMAYKETMEMPYYLKIAVGLGLMTSKCPLCNYQYNSIGILPDFES